MAGSLAYNLTHTYFEKLLTGPPATKKVKLMLVDMTAFEWVIFPPYNVSSKPWALVVCIKTDDATIGEWEDLYVHSDYDTYALALADYNLISSYADLSIVP